MIKRKTLKWELLVYTYAGQLVWKRDIPKHTGLDLNSTGKHEEKTAGQLVLKGEILQAQRG